MCGGSMWKGGEFKPAGINKQLERVGQTAAIRVNMSTREARLFVDDEEQPGIFTDIPSPLCLGITTGFLEANRSVEVLWLKRLRGTDEKQRSENDDRELVQENNALKPQNDDLTQKQSDLPIWVGTESLQTLDTTVHTLTPTTLTQIIATPKDKPYRTAFTFPIDGGEWELTIIANEIAFWGVCLSFLRHPLPENVIHKDYGHWTGETGGTFILSSGSIWKGGGEFKPEGTNKKCINVGQSAAIRVNMTKREARLFVDDEEQPGIFTDIPSPLCLGISTRFFEDNQSVEVLWLKQLQS
ncbi:hypothetical protein BLNAU_24663 [Blattamonas nauphoetae]|uniref:NHR domain-containing protein n=1 Tax=Blattamonas nauphoetae TaxID=2049346 RepID=A0ABQ9WPM7_9EUKA|nr:hypothetical protein BLNAU_24663 [Blattamonas nauphoetae]